MTFRSRARGLMPFITLIALAGGSLDGQTLPVPFALAVWGQDDALLPFAEFDGRRWRSSWPQPRDTAVDQLPLARIPPSWWGAAGLATAWELVDSAGARRRLRMLDTAETGLGSSCSVNLGLKTDAPAGTYEYAHAIASSQPGVIAPVGGVERNSAAARSILALLPWMFHQYQARAWSEVIGASPNSTWRWSTPVIDKLFAAPGANGEFAYFESHRDYAESPEQRLGDWNVFIQGWVWRQSPESAFQSVDIDVGLRDSDGKGPAVLLPLGVVHQGTRSFWVGALRSYAYSGMTVLDVSRGGVTPLLTVDYPGC